MLRRLGGTMALGAMLVVLVTAGGLMAADPSPPGTIRFIGKNAFATADGTFHAWRVVDRSIDPADPAGSWAVVEIDLASVDTGIARRDDHLRDPDFFEVETWPTARVRAHSLAPAGANDENRPRFTAKFDVELHGVQNTIDGEVVLVETSPTTFEGTLVVDRMAFGVGPRPSRWNPMSIDAEIPVRFRVAF
ncbi:MAG: YceI family protein [bacterium]|nr:YceI family protein [bacterium]